MLSDKEREQVREVTLNMAISNIEMLCKNFKDGQINSAEFISGMLTLLIPISADAAGIMTGDVLNQMDKTIKDYENKTGTTVG